MSTFSKKKNVTQKPGFLRYQKKATQKSDPVNVMKFEERKTPGNAGKIGKKGGPGIVPAVKPQIMPGKKEACKMK